MRALAFDELPRAADAFDRARAEWEEALARAGRDGNDLLRAAALCNLGWSSLREGRVAEADGRWRTALPLFRMYGDASGELVALDGSARAALLEGRPKVALQLCDRALSLAVDPALEQRARLLRAELWERLGRWTAAVAEARAVGGSRGKAVEQRAGSRLADGALEGTPAAALLDGLAVLAAGRPDEALEAFDQARVQNLAEGWPVEAAMASLLSAAALADAGRPKAAEGLLAEAELELEHADPVGVAPPFDLARAHVAAARGEQDVAEALVASARARTTPPCGIVRRQLELLDARLGAAGQPMGIHSIAYRTE